MPGMEPDRADEDIVILLLIAEHLEHRLRRRRLPEVVGAELSFRQV